MIENGMLNPHWKKYIMNGIPIYGCSECDSLFNLNGEAPKENEYYYCPKCGKKMSDFVEDTEMEIMVA